ncbi:MAG: hypothetical protein NVSMB51_01540 [Solirubrobacteraceae bacterium]
MRRLPPVLMLILVLLLLLAPAALAHDGGQGLYGETNDKVVTDAGFILIIFFPAFVTVMSLLQHRLDKRKAERKKARGASAQWRGGW